MECKFLKIGDHSTCKNKTTKNSDYCAPHNYLIKKSKARPCLKCNKGTSTKHQICIKCGGASVRVLRRYYEIDREYRLESYRLRQIPIN